MNLTIKQLRQSGFKVRVIHSRLIETYTEKSLRGNYASQRLSCKGGTTKIEVTTPDKQTTVVGIARCNAKDYFNRKLGNEIALGRALSNLPVKKQYILFS